MSLNYKKWYAGRAGTAFYASHALVQSLANIVQRMKTISFVVGRVLLFQYDKWIGEAETPKAALPSIGSDNSSLC